MSKKIVRKKGLAITEAKLRKIIKEELAKKILIQEGFLDSFKNAFSKLKDEAKKWVLDKATEIAKQLAGALKSIQVPEDVKGFLDSLSQQEGGATVEELVKLLPFSEELSELEKAKDLDMSSLVSAQTEGLSYSDLRFEVMLSEEKYVSRRRPQRLNESLIGASVGAWYALTKTVVTTCSLTVFALETAAKMSSFLGFKKAEHFFEKLAQKLEHAEEWFVKKVAFPAPIQYAAYLAFVGIKKAKGDSQKVLSFKEFQTDKEMKENVVRGLKIALLLFIVAEALLHIGHALMEFFENVKKSVSQIVHSAEHVGLETRSAARAGAELARGGSEVVKGAGEAFAAKAFASHDNGAGGARGR
jgi:hypothetical protein